MELLAVNPALAFCLANCDQFRRWTGPTPAAFASFVAGRRQRDILGWLGFPAAESAARIFRKILPEAITPSAARVLRYAWRSEPGIVKLLGHLQAINAGVLGLVTNLKLLAAVSPKLVAQVGADSRENLSPRTRVLRPQRATLAIKRGPNGSWKIAELKAAKNRSVSACTEATVRRWLSLHSISV